MSNRTSLSIGLAGMTVLPFCPGCITGTGVSQVAQDVELEITDSSDGTPAAGAWVSLAETHNLTSGEPLSDDELNTQYLSQFGTTGSDGQVTIPVTASVFCHFVVPGPRCPDPVEERVTGRAFIVKVESDLGVEKIEITLEPGAVQDGDLYTVTVISIGEAYIE